ncbi:MAG: carbohydrate binding domain-containing protein [Formivibrio sp.]|nr:carbohydrate binding domain-containing protein [Formivibrio sp.]
MSICAKVCIGLLALVSLHAGAGELFPWQMPWDDASANITSLSSWNAKPAGAQGFVRAEGGHLYAGSQRLRLLGVNIVFGSASPSREDADRIAARLARFGINIVRFHHMDSSPVPNGLLQKDLRTLDPAQLDRFDYFVSALKREGIYSDINLHVGRNYPGFAGWGESTPKYWKGVDNFYPAMIALQQDYARDLLTHRNPYTGNRYVDEPAVALVEINNENGLLREWRSGSLNEMTEPYRAELMRQWQAWLGQRYASTAQLRAAWGVVDEPLGTEMLTDMRNVRGGERGWNLQLVGGAQAVLDAGESLSTQLSMARPGTEAWHIQLHQNGLGFVADRPYTLALRVKADRPMTLGITAMQAHAPWQRLWGQTLVVGEQWQTLRYTFAPNQSDNVARLTLTGLGLETGKLWIEDASLKPGGLLGLKPDEALEKGTVAVVGNGDFLNRTAAGQRDWLQFLWDTEINYWTGMQHYLHQGLGARMPIIGTQVSYSPSAIQGLLDVVDGHAYWQHPRFPGKPWDMDNWHIDNSPMAGIATGGTLPDLALRRVPGKPFVVTEYNHPAPSLYQAEALPLLAAYGALQDWDGFFVYSYGAHQKVWNPGFINNFFDSLANPVKLTSLIASAALLRRADVASPGLPSVKPTPSARWIEAMRRGHLMPSAEDTGVARTEALVRPVSMDSAAVDPQPLPVRSVTGELVWGVNGGRTVTINTPKSKGLIGGKAGRIDLDGVSMELLEARNDWGVLLATVMTGKNFSSPGRILLTALGQMENTGQTWLDDKKTTLGRNWGRAPVLVEGIGARVVLPVPAHRVHAWALDERGNRREAVPVLGNAQASLEIGERYHTLWYELELR